MKQEIETLSFEEVANKIPYLRNLGKIEEASEKYTSFLQKIPPNASSNHGGVNGAAQPG